MVAKNVRPAVQQGLWGANAPGVHVVGRRQRICACAEHVMHRVHLLMGPELVPFSWWWLDVQPIPQPLVCPAMLIRMMKHPTYCQPASTPDQPYCQSASKASPAANSTLPPGSLQIKPTQDISNQSPTHWRAVDVARSPRRGAAMPVVSSST
jgi:hypothetical protein